MGFSRLFRSRCPPFWSAGAVWTAYDVAADAPEPVTSNAVSGVSDNAVGQSTDAAGTALTTDDLAILANAVG
ncbi:hypothetical protein [Sphingomonas sp. Leaf38]|uniref:hypothetical protein n=1 Tax=Sphingomonas sp. Leaf38 TaxID=1736217 RepID=UPI000AB34016|nr:hypothetical protein [Sphingomonas sp. Leaf38]